MENEKLTRYQKYRKSYEEYKKKHKKEIQLWREQFYKKYPDYHAKRMDARFFGGNRETVLRRDNYTCQQCGMSNEEHLNRWNRSITVDHIDGNGTYSKVQNNSVSNLVTLCLSCHGRKDKLRGLNKDEK